MRHAIKIEFQQAALQAESAQRLSADVSLSVEDFAPRDLAIGIGVQTDGEINVAQRNVPLAGDGCAMPRPPPCASAATAGCWQLACFPSYC